MSTTDAICYYALKLTVYVLFGWTIKLDRISVRFSIGGVGATEIIIVNLRIVNPPGGYINDNLLELERLELHADLTSVVKAMIKKTYRFYSFPAIAVKCIMVRGSMCLFADCWLSVLWAVCVANGLMDC